MGREVSVRVHDIFSWISYVVLDYFGIQDPTAYAYTANSNCLEVEGIDDVKDFAETLVNDITIVFHGFPTLTLHKSRN